MFEQIMQMIQQGGQESIVNNNAVPNEHNEAVMQEAHSAITNGLRQLAAGGNLEQLTQNPQALTGHPAMQNISGDFIGNVMKKFGLSKDAASGIAGSLIPTVLNKITGAGNQQAGNFNLGGLLSSLGGSNLKAGAQGGGGIMDTLSSLGAKMGLDKDGDGDVDLNDLSKLIR